MTGSEENDMRILLAGVVGSTAYGLNGPDSDVDRLGMYAAPTAAFHGLDRPAESRVATKPDATFHEVGKYCRLALKGNPTVSELMWLGDYEVTTSLGEELVAMRAAFLSAPAVMSAYLGYAQGQLAKLMSRGDGSYDSDIPARRALKHSIHIARLVEQGEHLYTTGELVVRLPDPEGTRAVGRYLLEDPRRGLFLIQGAEGRMKRAGSPLPEKPDRERVGAWLLRVRAELFALEGIA